MNTILKCNFSLSAENSDQIKSIISKLDNNHCTSSINSDNTQISLEFAVESVDILQNELLKVGPILAELNGLTTPSQLHCAGDIPELLKSSLAPFQPNFITMQQYQTLYQ